MRAHSFDGISKGFAVAFLVLVWRADAADYTWTGAASALWNTVDANWTGAGTVWVNGSANNAVFDSNGPKTVAADPVTLGNLTFTADGYTVGGGPLLMHGVPSVGAAMTATLTAPVTNVGVWAKAGDGTIILDPHGSVSNMFYALKAAGGTVAVAGGTNLVTQTGSNPETAPAFWVSGGTLLVGGGVVKTTGGSFARVSDYGHLWVTNGLCDLSGNSELLHAFNSPGMTTVEGSGVLDTERVRIVKNIAGAQYSMININTGGTLRLKDFWYETEDARRKATINLNGGRIVGKDTVNWREMLGGTAANWSNIIVNVLAGGAIFDNNGCNFYVRQKLTGSAGDGGLTKQGNGTLSLRGTNTYTGATVIRGGTLDLATDHNLGAIPAAPTTNVLFMASAVLQASASHALNANRTLWITNSATATLNTSSATQTIHGVIVCAETNSTFQKTGNGTVVLNPGADKVNLFGTLQTAAGTLVIASGTNMVTHYCGVQNGPGLRVNGGVLLVAGGVLKTTAQKYVNVDGGHLLVTNGVVDTTSCDEILNGINSPAGYTSVSGSGILIANRIRISQNTGNPSNNVVSANTGGVMRLNQFYIDVNFPAPSGILRLNGGTVQARINEVNFLGTTETLIGNSNDKWLTNIFVHVMAGGAVFDTDGKNISIKQPLLAGVAGDGGLRKRGAGTLTLMNTNTYNGVTVVEGGTLKWGRNDVLSSANTVMAASNGVFDVNGKTQTLAGLGGGGTVTNLAALTVTDTLAPGDAAGCGTLTLAGNAASIAGCTLSVAVSDAGTGDRLHVQGDLDLSSLALQVENPEQLSRFKKYTVASCTGTLTAPFASLGALPPRWTVRYDAVVKTAYLVYDFGTLLSVR